MIVEITETDIKQIGELISKEMLTILKSRWTQPFGMTEASTPLQLLQGLIRIFKDPDRTESQSAEAFAAYLEIEQLGLLYTKLLTGHDYSKYESFDELISELLPINDENN